ncbi:hypothetical protein GOP47_0015346 [Adiantum capillus-veneris]|uniref:Uncharacterized protein n=1 Tax=Adiantum capillus-veneris TaxID=13818 RepID=A0A9D4UJL1_ADICA|nr:hypothetical protein GOP47_0015346 [Adiantum capillus-veneris]
MAVDTAIGSGVLVKVVDPIDSLLDMSHNLWRSTKEDNVKTLEDDDEDYDLADPASILMEMELSSMIFKYFNAKLTTLEKL